MMNMKKIVCPLCIFSVSSVFAAGEGRISPAESPNVILIMADDLGWGDVEIGRAHV